MKMRASRFGVAALVAVACVTAASCPEKHKYPGTEIVTFILTAKPVDGGVDECRDAGYWEVPLPDVTFTFLVIFSGDGGDTNDAIQWMTIQDFVRDASFDGRIFSSPYSAPRVFHRCGDGGAVDEDLRLVPISATQSPKLNGECPEDPTAPGAIPLDPAAGIFAPGWNNGHFEAVSACGRLTDTIHQVDGQPSCPPCTMTYEIIKGPRQ